MDTRFGRGGSRLPLERLPATARERIEEGLGSRIRSAESQPGGFSPGIAARVVLEDGRRAFIKAAGTLPNPTTPRLHRSEAGIAAALPASAPAPRLLGAYDDGDWVALVFEDVDGRPPELPWRADELERVLDGLSVLSGTLTPSPLEARSIGEALGGSFNGWRQLAEGAEDLSRLDGWTRRHLGRLAGLEAGWEAGALGDTLLHLDIRADNLLLTDDRVIAVDWPHAAIGAPWVDLLLMLPSVAMQGVPAPWQVFDRHPLARGAAPEAVTALLCAAAGFLVFRSLGPPSPGIPTIRDFQRMQAEEALAWLRHRTGWE